MEKRFHGPWLMAGLMPATAHPRPSDGRAGGLVKLTTTGTVATRLAGTIRPSHD